MNASSLAEILEQCARYGLGPDRKLRTTEGVHVEQVEPVSHALEAILSCVSGVDLLDVQATLQGILGERWELAHGAYQVLIGIFKLATDPRTRLTIVNLYTDRLYNDYPGYLRCLEALAPRLRDAVFFMGHDAEDDDGETYFVVDRCEIRGGAFFIRRRVAPPPCETFAIAMAMHR